MQPVFSPKEGAWPGANYGWLISMRRRITLSILKFFNSIKIWDGTRQDIEYSTGGRHKQ